MAELYVDVDALSELSSQLHQVKASLQEAKDNVDAYGARLGSSRINAELDDFVEGWKDGRKKIVEGIDDLVGRIRGAIDAYTTQEQQLVKAAGGDGAKLVKKPAR